MAHFLSPMLKDPAQPWTLRLRDGGTVLANTVEPAFASASRNRGLLGRDSLAPGTAIILAPCGAVHTWFMRFDIDVVYCDRDGRVLKCVAGLRPWRFSGVLRRGFAVIELAAGHGPLPEVGDVVELAR